MIYIQSNKEKTLPHHFDAACALYGAEDSALDYRLVNFDEILSGRYDQLIRQHLFVGSTEFMTEVFKRMGIQGVKLPMNSDREHEFITLGEARERAAKGEKLFIKPVEIKLFTGFVIDQMDHTSIRGIEDSKIVMAYKPFESKILSEWRAYIHNEKLVDLKNYSGDLFAIPKLSFITDHIQKNETEFPNAYTIDVGVLENRDNVVIEFNDMWAIGNYGIPNDTYLSMLRSRYFEIVRQKASQYA